VAQRKECINIFINSTTLPWMCAEGVLQGLTPGSEANDKLIV